MRHIVTLLTLLLTLDLGRKCDTQARTNSSTVVTTAKKTTIEYFFNGDVLPPPDILEKLNKNIELSQQDLAKLKKVDETQFKAEKKRLAQARLGRGEQSKKSKELCKFCMAGREQYKDIKFDCDEFC